MTAGVHTPFRVDFARPEDIEELGRVMRAGLAFYARAVGYAPAPMRKTYRRRVENNFVLRLAEGNRGVGYATLIPRRSDLYLDAIAIRPSRQRQGGGRLLIEQAELLAYELCFPALRLHTPAMSGPLGFYRSLGFTETGRDGYGDTAFAEFEKPVETALTKLLANKAR